MPKMHRSAIWFLYVSMASEFIVLFLIIKGIMSKLDSSESDYMISDDELFSTMKVNNND